MATDVITSITLNKIKLIHNLALLYYLGTLK